MYFARPQSLSAEGVDCPGAVSTAKEALDILSLLLPPVKTFHMYDHSWTKHPLELARRT
jgi:hypothetical protein